jgi:hypothetical protein|nr:MAG TPA: Exonuclease V [Crassvirales sp.]
MNIENRYSQVRLIFEEAAHKYHDTLGNEYISTTTLLHDLAPKFDKKYWLHKKAVQLGITEKELEEQWNTITKEACERGTNVHNGLEDGIKGSSKFKQAIQYLNTDEDGGEMITVADLNTINANYKLLDIKQFKEATDNKYDNLYEVFEKYTNYGYKIYAEIGMFLIDYLISGTIDVLLVNEWENKAVIGDWKTNRSGLRFTAGYYCKDKKQHPAQLTSDWVEKKEFLLPPVQHLPHCNGSIYNLQLSMYGKAVNLITGLKIMGCWLAHIDCDFELNEYGMPKRFEDGLYHIKENPVEKITFYNLPYREQEIDTILADRKLKLKAQDVKRNFTLGL